MANANVSKQPAPTTSQKDEKLKLIWFLTGLARKPAKVSQLLLHSIVTYLPVFPDKLWAQSNRHRKLLVTIWQPPFARRPNRWRVVTGGCGFPLQVVTKRHMILHQKFWDCFPGRTVTSSFMEDASLSINNYKLMILKP